MYKSGCPYIVVAGGDRVCQRKTHNNFNQNSVVKFGIVPFKITYDDEYLYFVHKGTKVARVALQGVLLKKNSILNPKSPICHFSAEYLDRDDNWQEWGYVEGYYDIQDFMLYFVDNILGALDLAEQVTSFTVEAASKWKKGDRIVIDWGSDGIYIGTVTSVRNNYVYVEFDDEDKAKYPEKSKKILGKGTAKKRKSAIPKNKLSEYLETEKTETKPKTKKTKPLEKPVVSDWEKNDRIIVRFGKKDYYIGRVSKTDSKYVYVTFDDADTGKFVLKSSRILGKADKSKTRKKIPEALTLQEAKKLMVDESTPTKDVKKTEPNKKMETSIKELSTDKISALQTGKRVPLMAYQIPLVQKYFEQNKKDWLSLIQGGTRYPNAVDLVLHLDERKAGDPRYTHTAWVEVIEEKPDYSARAEFEEKWKASDFWPEAQSLLNDSGKYFMESVEKGRIDKKTALQLIDSAYSLNLIGKVLYGVLIQKANKALDEISKKKSADQRKKKSVKLPDEMEKKIRKHDFKVAVVIDKERPTKVPASWPIFNAPRPIPGDENWQGDFRHGIYYSAVDPNREKEVVDYNLTTLKSLDAWLVRYYTTSQAIDWMRRYYKTNFPKSFENFKKLVDKQPDSILTRFIELHDGVPYSERDFTLKSVNVRTEEEKKQKDVEKKEWNAILPVKQAETLSGIYDAYVKQHKQAPYVFKVNSTAFKRFVFIYKEERLVEKGRSLGSGLSYVDEDGTLSPVHYKMKLQIQPFIDEDKIRQLKRNDATKIKYDSPPPKTSDSPPEEKVKEASNVYVKVLVNPNEFDWVPAKKIRQMEGSGKEKFYEVELENGTRKKVSSEDLKTAKELAKYRKEQEGIWSVPLSIAQKQAMVKVQKNMPDIVFFTLGSDYSFVYGWSPKNNNGVSIWDNGETLSINKEQIDLFVKEAADKIKLVHRKNEPAPPMPFFLKPKKEHTPRPADRKIGNTILQQIKALDAMALPAWRAHDFVFTKNGVNFEVKGAKFKGKVLIEYDEASDTYTVKFGRLNRTLDWVEKYKVKDVFADMLVEVIDDYIEE